MSQQYRDTSASRGYCTMTGLHHFLHYNIRIPLFWNARKYCIHTVQYSTVEEKSMITIFAWNRFKIENVIFNRLIDSMPSRSFLCCYFILFYLILFDFYTLSELWAAMNFENKFESIFKYMLWEQKNSFVGIYSNIVINELIITMRVPFCHSLQLLFSILTVI